MLGMTHILQDDPGADVQDAAGLGDAAPVTRLVLRPPKKRHVVRHHQFCSGDSLQKSSGAPRRPVEQLLFLRCTAKVATACRNSSWRLE